MNKVVIDRELFLSKLNKAIKFVPSKSIIPAFDNFLLKVNKTTMEIIGCNPATQVRIDCQVVSSTADFSICVPAKLFVKTISLFSENNVTITQKKDIQIELKCGKSKYNIGMDCFPDTFPRIEVKEMTNEINMSQFYLRLGLKSANSFVDDDNKNANMTAINVIEVNNKIVFTGLVEALMCRASVPPISINKWDKVNISAECASKVVSLLGDKGEVGVSHNGDHIMFFTDKDSPEMFEVISTVANVRFPNSESLFSKRPDNLYMINTLECNAAVKRLKLYASEGDTKLVRFELNEGNELMLTSADTLTNKDGEESILMENKTNTPIGKFFSHDHLIQVLSSIETNDFWLHYSDQKNHPSFIIPKVNTEEENIFCFLIAEFTK